MSWEQFCNDYWPILWPTLLAIGFILACVPVVGLYATFVERKLAGRTASGRSACSKRWLTA
jgi:NADH:ubiquinone oxidoreductase subunit H